MARHVPDRGARRPVAGAICAATTGRKLRSASDRVQTRDRLFGWDSCPALQGYLGSQFGNVRPLQNRPWRTRVQHERKAAEDGHETQHATSEPSEGCTVQAIERG